MGVEGVSGNMASAGIRGDAGVAADIAVLGEDSLNLQKDQKSPLSDSEIAEDVAAEIAEMADPDKPRRAEDKKSRSARESEAEKDGIDHFPDLMQNRKHRQFMQKLRRQQMRDGGNPGTPEEMEEEAKAFFEDDAQSYYSLVYASDVFAAEGREEIARILKEAAASLEQENGEFIRAGKNISQSATAFVEAGLGTYEELRKFYHQQVYDFHDVCSTFIALYSKYSKDRFKESIDFLTTALSTDLESTKPSCDREVLESTINDFYQVRFLDGFHKELEAKFMHMMEMFVLDDPCEPIDLTEGVLRFVNLEWVNPEELRGLKDLAGCEELESEIYLFTQLFQSLRGIPVKIFLDNQKREDLLATLQDVIDDSIREEEDNEEGGNQEEGEEEG